MLPLLSHQEDLLFHSLVSAETESCRYRLQCEFPEKPHQNALLNAWTKLAIRYPALRSSFVAMTVEKPVQVIRRNAQQVLESIDLSGAPELDRAAQLAGVLKSFFSAPISVERPPLTRLALVKYSET